MRTEHIAIKPILEVRNFLKNNLTIDSHEEIPSLDLKLNEYEKCIGKKQLYSLFKNEKNTICLFTNATGEKCYSEEWWLSFYDKLKVNFPDYNFIEILPIENTSKLSFKIDYFYSKDIRKIASIISNCKLFIGADSGMMHLASASKTTTIGLFKVTDVNIYEPYNNKSKAFNTNITTEEEIIASIYKRLE